MKEIIARPQVDEWAQDVASSIACYECSMRKEAMNKYGRIEAVCPHCCDCKYAVRMLVEVEVA